MSDLENATLQWLNDLTAQGILTTDAELQIRGWNRWLETHSGMKSADVIGRSLLEVFPDLERRRLDQWYHHALHGQVMVLAYRLHRYLLPLPAGYDEFAHMQQSARIAPLTADGRIVGTITVIEDVTEREVRENELRRQIGTLEALHEVSQSILSLDLPECLQRLAETSAALFHAPIVAVVLRYDDRLQVDALAGDTDDIDATRVNQATSIALAVVRSGQSQVIADAATRPHMAPLHPHSRSVITTPLIADGSVIGALVIEAPEPQAFAAVDQRHVMMLATQAAIGIRNAQLYRSAQDAIQVRDNFVSIASHELKTPLTTILGNAEMLQRRNVRSGNLPERDQRTLTIIAAQATRLNRMVATLLDVTRIQTGQLSIERAPLDVGILSQRVADDLQPMLYHHQIELSVPEEPLIIEGDELRLEQVFYNLLQNAVKYSPSGGLVRLGVAREAGVVRMTVTDQGIGIPESALPQLFGRFYRADNVREMHISGMGVGLFVVKQIIELHHGQIDVVSQENVGTTFIITLPLA